MKVLISGLSGTGKTTLADRLYEVLSKDYTCARINADDVRAETNNWDFSIEGRFAQLNEILTRANALDCDLIICDFIAPLNEIRTMFNADYSVWMNTSDKSKFADTDKLYESFEDADYIVAELDDKHVDNIVEELRSLL